MKFRIHGDNIIECERALRLLELAYDALVVNNTKNIFMPLYILQNNGKKLFEVELLGGHSRWDVNFTIELAKNGAPLREATDAYITKVSADNKTEELLLAIEFCNALPAGNNAWQRSGRAVTCAEIGVPYFYFAEIGGVELDAGRNVKAPRFPNPIVPFSYLTSSKSLKVVCVPIYQAHPAITDALRKKFMHIFGLEASLDLLKCIIEGSHTDNAMKVLDDKGLALVKILSNDRNRVDTFRALEWEEFLKITTGSKKSEWIKNNPDKQTWKKKSSDKVAISDSFKAFLSEVQKLNCLSIGAKEIPICLIANGNIRRFAELLKMTYLIESIEELVNAIEKKNKPFLIVWITGFKPRGDDSRPDRGLVPLARMLFGNEIDILTIVYGPAKKYTWNTFKEDPSKLVTKNELWQAIMNLSNYVLADSITSDFGVLTNIISRDLERKNVKVIFNAAKPNGKFSEHDVDTAIHTMFSRQRASYIFESMCNPPGGDWSGISYWDFSNNTEYRWTSLPRVSIDKRPDHVIQYNYGEELFFICIESKPNAIGLKQKNNEENINVRLKKYIKTLLEIPPTAVKYDGEEWEFNKDKINPIKKCNYLSGGAFCFKSIEEMKTTIESTELSLIMAFEFKSNITPSIVHVMLSNESKFLGQILTDIVSQFSNGLEIKIY